MTENPIILPYDLDGGWTSANLRNAAAEIKANSQRIWKADLLLNRIADRMDEANPPPMSEPVDVGAVVYAQVVKMGAFQRMLKFSNTRTLCWINEWGGTYSWNQLINPHE